MTPAVRETMFLQSKCGIRPGVAFDFSKEHILEVGRRQPETPLGPTIWTCCYLHRPDALVEPEEVAEAFGILQANGKVRHFGISNQSPMQIQLLRKSVKQPLVANQLQLSITNATMITRGMHVNMLDGNRCGPRRRHS